DPANVRPVDRAPPADGLRRDPRRGTVGYKPEAPARDFPPLAHRACPSLALRACVHMVASEGSGPIKPKDPLLALRACVPCWRFRLVSTLLPWIIVHEIGAAKTDEGRAGLSPPPSVQGHRGEEALAPVTTTSGTARSTRIGSRVWATATLPAWSRTVSL